VLVSANLSQGAFLNNLNSATNNPPHAGFVSHDQSLPEFADIEHGDIEHGDIVLWEEESCDQGGPKLSAVLGFLAASFLVMAIVGLISTLNLYAAALLYVIAFSALAFWRLHLAMALTVALVPFQQDLGGGLPIKMGIAELNLFLLVPNLILVLLRLPISWRLIFPPAFYLLFCALATLGRLDGNAIKSIFQMVLYLILAVGVFAQARRSPAQMMWCFDCLVVVMTAFALVGLATNFRAMGIHKNGWGASLSLGLIVAFELWQSASDKKRKRWLLASVGILSIGLVLTVSRGGWLAAMTGIGALLMLRRDWATLWMLGRAVVPLAIIGWMLLPDDLQEYAVGFDNSRWNIKARWESVDFTIDVWKQSPIMGSGVGLRKEYDATNVVLLVLAETGIIGLFLFLLIHANVVWFVWQSHRGLSSRSMVFSCVALGGALVFARLAHGCVDHYWSRGAILAAWAAAGMAVAAAGTKDR
jgi:hypothetical protein